jgi:hypothetical protein
MPAFGENITETEIEKPIKAAGNSHGATVTPP